MSSFGSLLQVSSFSALRQANPRVAFAVLSCIPCVVSLSYAAALMHIPTRLQDQWLIDPDKKPSASDLRRWCKWLMPNIFMPILGYLLYTESVLRWGDEPEAVANGSDGFGWRDLFMAWSQVQLQEFTYYFMHRAQHENKTFYKVHKTHHTVRTPRALSFSVHGVVDTWLNFVVTFAWPLLFWYCAPFGKLHVYANIGVWTWNLVAGAETHSGFWRAPITDLTFLPIDFVLGKVCFDHSPAHYYHHKYNLGTYGHWMDHIFGTDKEYTQWRRERGCQDITRQSMVRDLLPFILPLPSLETGRGGTIGNVGSKGAKTE